MTSESAKIGLLAALSCTTWLLLTGCAEDRLSRRTHSYPGGLNGDANRQAWPVLISLASKDFTESSGLRLQGGAPFTGKVEDCLSGYEKNVDQSQLEIQIQDGDFNCLFKLTQIQLGTEIFTFDTVSSWAEGTSFSAVGDQGSHVVFNVIANINSPVVGPQSVFILYGQAEEGAAQQTGADIDTGISVQGAKPIGLDIVNSDVTVNPGDGAGVFNFTFECETPVTGSGAEIKCKDDRIVDLVAYLARDTYGPNLTLSECRDLANGLGAGGNTGTPFSIGAHPNYPNGGMFSGNIIGPGRLFKPENADLVLAIAGTQSDSGCKFFRVTIIPPF